MIRTVWNRRRRGGRGRHRLGATGLTWCRDHLAAHKVPRSVILVPELPRTSRGKLDRPALLALAGAATCETVAAAIDAVADPARQA